MILFPPAKINLGLNVIGKRPDGYHNINTCMFPIPFFDVLEILPSQELVFNQTGLTINSSIEDNLVVRAFHRLNDEFNIPNAYIHLRKNIPMGAGLGGGSADASYTLLGLNNLFSLGLSNDKLKQIATELGSDCPFFIENGAKMASGRGEVLSQIEVDLSGYFIKLINPDIHIGTSEAYAGLSIEDSKLNIESILKMPTESWKMELKNDFEKSIFNEHKKLADIKECLYEEGAIYASMTGSGSTLYGLFKTVPIKNEQFGKEWVLSL